MYGHRLSGTSHPGGKVTHLVEWDGRKVHVVDWTDEQIADFKARHTTYAQRMKAL